MANTLYEIFMYIQSQYIRQTYPNKRHNRVHRFPRVISVSAQCLILILYFITDRLIQYPIKIIRTVPGVI